MLHICCRMLIMVPWQLRICGLLYGRIPSAQDTVDKSWSTVSQDNKYW